MGAPTNDPKQMSNVFNNHFSSVGRKLAASIPTSSISNVGSEHLIPNCSRSIFLEDISTDEIFNMILALDPSKSSPSFACTIKFFKMAATEISPVLSSLFNLCIKEGTFPECLKLAEIIPVFKAGSKSDVHNYRPISLLSPISKLFEKCLHKRISSFLKSNNSLYAFQFGFRDNSSTENAVAQIYDKLLEELNNKKVICSIFVDMRKAFDTVNHRILVQKMYRYGIRGVPLQLLESYLNGRQQ